MLSLIKKNRINIVITMLILISLVGIYSNLGWNVYYFLYASFVCILSLMAMTDIRELLVDDKTCLIGILIAVFFQIYLGNFLVAIKGAVISVVFSCGVRLFGKCLPTIQDVDSIENVKLPLVPFLAIAIIINGLLPGGIINQILNLILKIISNKPLHYSLTAILVISGVYLLLHLYRRRSECNTVEESNLNKQNDEQLEKLGTGDILISALIGFVVGWQSFIAIFIISIFISVLYLLLYQFQKLKVSSKE